MKERMVNQRLALSFVVVFLDNFAIKEFCKNIDTTKNIPVVTLLVLRNKECLQDEKQC